MKRDTRLTVWVAAAEHSDLRIRAERRGLTLAAYVRQLLLRELASADVIYSATTNTGTQW